MVQNSYASISASIGISIYPNDAQNPKELLEHADQAMYEAKFFNDSSCCYFHELGNK